MGGNNHTPSKKSKIDETMTEHTRKQTTKETMAIKSMEMKRKGKDNKSINGNEKERKRQQIQGKATNR